jgi:hypothetical protein
MTKKSGFNIPEVIGKSGREINAFERIKGFLQGNTVNPG